MRKKLLSALKMLLVFLLLITAFLTIMVIFPLPDLPMPNSHDRVLIKSINLIDVETGVAIPNQNVLIEHDRIRSITSADSNSIFQDALVIEGKGKYLSPGLWDMHTHSSPYSPWLHHPLYIANGVTGIRDMSGQLNEKDSFWVGTKERLEWNRELLQQKRIAPRYVLQSSFQIDGSGSIPSSFPDFFKAQNDADASRLLSYYKEEGADFIKVYSNLPADSYRALATKASSFGLHLAGHKPLGVSLEEAILLGQRSFEHGRIFMFDCFTESQQLLNATDKIAAYRRLKPLMVTNFDFDEARRLMDLMQHENTYWTPTLQTLKADVYSDIQKLKSNPDLKYIPKMMQMLWWNPLLGRDGNKTDTEKLRINETFYRAAQEQVFMAARHEVPIMAGTDVTDTNVFPGFSLHAELEDLVEAGLSNHQALLSATITPAKFCKLEKDFGSIEEGKFADLLILSRNPLEEISNTRSIQGVMLAGSYYNLERIDLLKSITESTASSVHMNVKFIYSLLSSPLMRKQLAD